MEKLKKSKKYIIAIIVSVVLLMLLLLLKMSTFISENVFANGISKAWIFVFSKITSIFPFSVFELMIAIIVVSVFTSFGIMIYYSVKKIKNKTAIIWARLFLGLMILINIYTISAGFAYNKNPLYVEIYQQDIEKEDLLKVAENYIAELNSLSLTIKRDIYGEPIMPYSIKELSKIMKNEYITLNNPQLNVSNIPTAKPIIFSPIMSYTGIIGIYFAPTGEININTAQPTTSIIHTLAHEMAHSAGVMKENEANLVSYEILFNIQDALIRYCTMQDLLPTILSAVRNVVSAKEYENIKNSVAKEIFKEYELRNEYWRNHTGIIDNISSFFNNIYLKLNGVENGTGSYETNEDYVDSGEKDEDGNIIYDVIYSDVQRLIIKNFI